MSDYKIEWTDEKRKAVCDEIEKWINKYGAGAGEVIMQSDNCLIYAPELLSDLVDDIIKPEYIGE